MRLIAFALAGLLLLIQFPLWIGKGGWLRTWELDKQLVVAQKRNAELKARNAKLESEVSDLKQGTGAVEERARYELGMIKDDEVFIQVVDANSSASATSAPVSNGKAVAASPIPTIAAPPEKPRSIPRSPVAADQAATGKAPHPPRHQ